MIAIFKTQAEAVAYADKIHSYLTANRPRYNAVKWEDPIESDAGGEWRVKQPTEEREDRWPVKLDSSVELKDASITKPMPEEGEIVAGEYYLDKGSILKPVRAFIKTKEDTITDNFTKFKIDEVEIISKEPKKIPQDSQI